MQTFKKKEKVSDADACRRRGGKHGEGPLVSQNKKVRDRGKKSNGFFGSRSGYTDEHITHKSTSTKLVMMMISKGMTVSEIKDV